MIMIFYCSFRNKFEVSLTAWVSSLRPELAAIARTLQATALEADLLYLCDSEAALNKVSRWIGSGALRWLVMPT